MKRLLIASMLLAATSVPVAAATAITVANVGAILNQSVPLPAEATPGSGGPFEEFFKFTLPVAETVTVSMSDSATGIQKITGGLLSLNDWTTTGVSPLFIPMGALIESSPIATVIGGQEATVTPDRLDAGAYFAEISGTSGLSPIKIAVDGTATAVVPEASTWTMLLIGLGFLAWGAMPRRHGRELEMT
jgi:hypothetical protein